MGAVYKTSRAQIRPADPNSRFVYLLESENPEERFAQEIRGFLETVGYSDLFPNFDNLRVGTVHPFSILLAQEVLNEAKAVNIFPAITVVDSTMSQDAEQLSDGYSPQVWTVEDLVNAGGYREAGLLFCADDGWAKVVAQAESEGSVIGVTREYHTTHSIDFNIWSENKEVTSFLFDMVSHFVTQKRVDLHQNAGLDIMAIQGRRSGDINLDFGKLLYGANVTVALGINHRAVLFDLAVTTISEIDTLSLPSIFALNPV